MQKIRIKLNINFLINKRESTGLNHFNDPKAFIEYSNDMQDVYKDIDEYNYDQENKILIIFDDMIADMINNKKLNSVITELFTRGRKLNISIVLITQSYFKVPKNVRLNTTHFFITKIPNKRELPQISLNHTSDISTKDFIKIHKICTAELSFLVVDSTLASDNPLRLSKKSFKHIIKLWQLMIRLKMKNYNMILIEKQPKYQPYHQTKFINMDILLLKIYYHPISNK